MRTEDQKRLESLEAEVGVINTYLKTNYATDPETLQQRLIDVSAYNARTGEMLAEAEYILTKAKGEALTELLEKNPGISANQQKVMVEAACAYAIKVVRLIERANRATVHTGEFTITQSYVEKENMSLTRKGY